MGIYILPEKKKSVYISATIGIVLATIMMSVGFDAFASIMAFIACLTFTTTMQSWKSSLVRLRENGTESKTKDDNRP